MKNMVISKSETKNYKRNVYEWEKDIIKSQNLSNMQKGADFDKHFFVVPSNQMLVVNGW